MSLQTILGFATGVVPLIVVILELLLKKKVNEIHVMVNSEKQLATTALATANAKIDQLVAALATANGNIERLINALPVRVLEGKS